MDGVAAGKPLEVRYGLVLRAEFVSAGKDSGPMRDLYFKILPKGTCSIAGCLVGFPVIVGTKLRYGFRKTSAASCCIG